MTSTDVRVGTVAALVVHGPDDLRVEQVALPPLPADAVRIRIAYGGVCGSDLHYAAHGRNGDYVVHEPLVLGHEVSGTVAEVGRNVPTTVRTGTRVAVHPATPSPVPGAAREAALNRFPGGTYLGSASTTPHTQGAFAEYIDVRADQLRALPEGLSLRRAALAEPLAVALHGVDLAGPVEGRTALVSGAGPIGLLAVLALRHRGAARIVATDLQASALSVARSVGADETILLGKDSVPQPGSAEIVIEASGAPAALRSALHNVASGGMIVQLGILPPEELPMTFGELQVREITLRGSWRFDVELDEAVSLLAAHPEADDIISHEFALPDAIEAFRIAADASASSKVLLRIDPDIPTA